MDRLRADRGDAAPGAAEDVAAAPALRAPLLDRKTAVASAGILAAVPAIGWYTWWADEKKTSFHLANEGWFGRTAVAGGADKASHFVVSAMLEDAGEAIYRSLGKDERQARLAARDGELHRRAQAGGLDVLFEAPKR